MPQLPEFILHWITAYGDLGLFVLLALGIVGLPIPDETLMAFAGVLIAQGKLSLPLTILTAFAGTAFGITLSYLLGRTIGGYLVQKIGYRIGITEQKILKVQQWFDRTGKWALFIGYFIPGVRHLTGYVAGTARVSFLEFAFFAYSGALAWSLVFLSLGYFFSHNWEKVVAFIDSYLWMGAVVVAVMMISYIGWRLWKRKI